MISTPEPKSFERHCAEPWLSHIASGRKQVEGRLKRSIFAELCPGDTVTWYDGDLRVPTRIVTTRFYSSFKDMLTAEGLENVLPEPGVNTLEDGVNVYRQYFSEEDEKLCGVLAVQVALL